MKFLISFFLCLICAAPVWSIDLEKGERVANRAPGYCAWASVEMLGRHHKIKSLYDLVEKRSQDADEVIWHQGPYGWHAEIIPRNRGYEWNVRKKLNALGVKFREGRNVLNLATECGCLCGFRTGAFGPSAHAVVLTYIDDKKVEFVDPNHIALVYEASRQWFNIYWSGWALVIDKNQ